MQETGASRRDARMMDRRHALIGLGAAAGVFAIARGLPAQAAPVKPADKAERKPRSARQQA